MSKPETMMIDDVKYIREDSIKTVEPAAELDGLPYVICRSRNQGVMCGYLVDREGQEVLLRRARQIWSWAGAFTVVEIANRGIKSGKLSEEAELNTRMTECCGVFHATLKAQKSLEGIKPHVA